jgi:5-methylcytosine-specific restriction endonuclease McrA
MSDLIIEKRPNITKKVRASVHESTSGLCFYCDKTIYINNTTYYKNAEDEKERKKAKGVWNVDHVKPRSQGGADDQNNYVPACWRCNNKKSDISYLDYFALLGKTPRCLGNNVNGTKCRNKIAEGNVKFCTVHTTAKK